MGYTENIGMAITIKSREPEKPPAKSTRINDYVSTEEYMNYKRN